MKISQSTKLHERNKQVQLSKGYKGSGYKKENRTCFPATNSESNNDENKIDKDATVNNLT